MVTKKQIEIVILSDGTLELKVLNAEGSECLLLTKDLEDSLGKVTQRDLKPEFYISNSESQELGDSK